ncbi:hypothetical protein [Methyloversatilis sp.]|uniref:hypothetical protein n=1 Tax=Methyloversatilis sp. TaxID=2569862 RepID=UPI002733B487|nr:hypothetical protein [Methyloversatilis sp.]MDP2867917.1 hypothetical protein [Methyloversatilis sp.]MDP3579030.1 hypothetical protein [Methyloversatilis sp.]
MQVSDFKKVIGSRLFAGTAPREADMHLCTISVRKFLVQVRQGKMPDAVKFNMNGQTSISPHHRCSTRRHVLAWCLLAGWLLSAGGLLLTHMQQNPAGVCVTRS